MLFNSFEFLIFFPIVSLIFFTLPHGWRWAWLLAASCYFYAAFIPTYLFILLLLIAIDYVAARQIERATGTKRKIYLSFSIVSMLTILFIFKYYNFFQLIIAQTVELLGGRYTPEQLSLVLPLGLSFHTFQSLSYVIEVYRENIQAERHLGRYALYVMFFPQLVAGPIERPQNLLAQLHTTQHPDPSQIAAGLKRMAWGFFKKMVIADRLALYVNAVYSHPGDYHGLPILIATYFFAFQIYADFSGYCDIAIGSAQVMGFRLKQNFRQPYFAASIAEFWQRWHISLSSWFRDYLYAPLGGNKFGLARQSRNILIVFIVSGLWHGANWTFLVWGALHGLFRIIELITQSLNQRFKPLLHATRLAPWRHGWRVVLTFHLVCFGWIFFRAGCLTEAICLIQQLFNFSPGWFTFNIGLAWDRLLTTTLLLGIFLVIEYFSTRHDLETWLSRQPWLMRLGTYYLLIMSILLLGEFGSRQFIYFQF